jgi:ABC-type protease/lipase transport system fused ATPase/permease subunit
MPLPARYPVVQGGSAEGLPVCRAENVQGTEGENAMKFTSRKFLLTLGAILGIIGAALTGEITWAQAVWPIILAVLGYVGIEGVADIKARPAGN